VDSEDSSGAGMALGAGAGVLPVAQATGKQNSIRKIPVNTQIWSFLTYMPFDPESPSVPIIACYRSYVNIAPGISKNRLT
jgi:hypothetical protein